MGGERSVYTLAEISEHNTSKDCWLLIDGKMEITCPSWCPNGFSRKGQGIWDRGSLSWIGICCPQLRPQVYNVTKFLDDHPGGGDVLLSSTGKDATDDFEDVGHSTGARAMLDEFYVGDIDSTTIPERTKNIPQTQPQNNQDNSSGFTVKLLQFLIPLIIFGFAVGIRFYNKSI